MPSRQITFFNSGSLYNQTVDSRVSLVIEDIAQYFHIPVNEIEVDNIQWKGQHSKVIRFPGQCGIISRFEPFVADEITNDINVTISVPTDLDKDYNRHLESKAVKIRSGRKTITLTLNGPTDSIDNIKKILKEAINDQVISK